MNVDGGSVRDDTLFAALLRVAREECAHIGWREMEPVLAASWERLRGPNSPGWNDVVERVRACCEDSKSVH